MAWSNQNGDAGVKDFREAGWHPTSTQTFSGEISDSWALRRASHRCPGPQSPGIIMPALSGRRLGPQSIPASPYSPVGKQRALTAAPTPHQRSTTCTFLKTELNSTFCPKSCSSAYPHRAVARNRPSAWMGTSQQVGAAPKRKAWRQLCPPKAGAADLLQHLWFDPL